MARGSTVLLDTSILINLLQGRTEARALVGDLTARGISLSISCVSVAELFAGMRASEEAVTEALLSALDCIPVNREIAREAGLIRAAQRRLGRTLALDDMMIAATAIRFSYPLVTDNRKDFEIPEIELYPA